MSRTLVWTGAHNGDFANALNWDDTTNGLDPAASPPTSSDFVQFLSSAGGTVNFDNGNAEQFSVLGSGSWTFFGTLTVSGEPNPPYLPNAFSISTTVTFSGVDFNASAGSGDIESATTPAVLTVEGASTVSVLNLSLGVTSGQSGTLIVTGAHTIFDIVAGSGNGAGVIEVGDGGVGSLTVTANAALTDGAGALIGYLSGSSGTATISDGGTWTAQSMSVGYSGSGTLTIESGGTLTTTGSFDAVASSTGSTGTVTVTGSGSRWMAGSQLTVGNSGNGTLDIVNGGSVSASQLTVGASSGSDGTLAITGGGTLSTTGTYLNIGSGPGSTGLVTVDGTGGASLWSAGGQIGVGVNGTGTLVVSNGGSVVATNEINIAENLSSTGTLTVESGGKIKSGGSYDTIGGNASNAVGIATVEGPNSSWVLTASLVVGGSNGTGTLDITNDGSVQAGELQIAQGTSVTGTVDITSGGTLVTAGPYDQLANSYKSVASVTVDGSGSEWNSAGQISVGDNGSATLVISNHGSVETATGLLVGQNGGATGIVTIESQGTLTTQGSNGNSIGAYAGGASGTVTVTGAGSLWDDGGNLAVGDSGNGTLDITNDGSVLAAQLVVGQNGSSNGTVAITSGSTLSSTGPYDNIGGNAGAFGTVTVDGLGSLWGTAGQIGVGATGIGTLIISDSGVVRATAGIGIGESGGSSGDLLIESGGTLSSGGTYVGIGGNAQNADGAATVQGSGSDWNLDGAILGIGSSGIGTLTITASGLVQAGQINVGNNTGSSGTLAITAGGTLATSGTYDTIAQAGGSIGSVSVTGTGSLYKSNDQLTIGQSGGGLLTIGGGGTVTADGYINVGSNTGGIGTLTINAGGTLLEKEASQSANYLVRIGSAGIGLATVSGAGALLNTNTNPLSIGSGAGGYGSLTVASGGTVDAGTATSSNAVALAIGSNGTGLLTVTGSGSTFNAVGFSYDGRAGTGSVLIESGGTLTSSADASGQSGFQIGAGRSSQTSGVGGSGSATVTSNGVLTVAQTVDVGGNGVNGTLSVNDGGIVNVGTQLQVGLATLISGVTYGGDGDVSIGPGGTVQITGPAQDTFIAVSVGNENTGPAPLASTGEVTVSGAGALLNSNGSNISVGTTGTGSLTISQGGSVVAGTPNSSDFGALRVGLLGVGSVSITGSGSSLTATGSTTIGRAGIGTLLVEDNAKLTVALDPTGSGNLAIGGGGNSASTSLYVGGTGTALVTTDGYILGQANIIVGANGITGALTINNGGTVKADQAINIGNSLTVQAGVSIISQSGSVPLTMPASFTGAGTINVDEEGTLEAAGGLANSLASIIVGNGTDSSGVLNVSGVGALVDAGGDRITIGNSGDGTLLVSQGGSVAASAANYTDTEAAASLGYAAGATGAVTVTDSGSSFTATGLMEVGTSGTGSLLVENAGTVTASSLDAGVAAGGSGVITITGAGSELNASGQFTIGDAASAELSILNGATATVGDMDIGLSAGGTGNVDLEGAKTLLHVTGDLHVGDAGSAVLTLGAGTELTIDGDFFTGTHGRVVGFGGTVDPKHYYNTGVTSGPLTVEASIAIVNTGTFIAENGELELNGPVTDTGDLDIESGGILQLDKSVAATQTVAFSGTGGVLAIKDADNFAPMISGYATGDTVSVYGISGQAGPTYSHAGGNTTLTYANGVALTFTGSYENDGITVVADDVPPPCFLTGTHIATERGEIDVEDLLIGDRVLIVSGGSRPIRWIGTRRVDPARHSKSRAVLPVRVQQGAFGPGLPHRDLFLSPDHALYVNDVLIPVQHLINGTTIRQMPASGSITYFHVELDRHDVLLAEGLPAESYLETGNRGTFENGGTSIVSHPDFAQRIWEAQGYAPLIIAGLPLEAARRCLATHHAMAA